jgi:hypothetical protein
MRWLAPALGVAAVLAVWFAVKPPRRAANRESETNLVAQAPREEAPVSPASGPVDQQPRFSPQQKKSADSFVAQGLDSSKTAPAHEPATPENAGSDAGTALDKISPDAAAAANSPQDEKKSKSPAAQRENPLPAMPSSSSLAMQEQPAVPNPATPQSQAKSASNPATTEALQPDTNSNAIENATSRNKQAAAVQGELGAAPGASPAQTASPVLRSEARKEQPLVIVSPLRKDSALLKAPFGRQLWRAGKAGSIELSTDAGKTWVSQPSPSREDWLAGAAFSDTVCWLAGRHGAIARTTDGLRWELISPPAQAAGSDGSLPDWTGITVSGAQSAAVSSSGGRTFSTADAGKTWQAR